MKSIITNDLKVCAECGTRENIEIHHCIHGTAGRKFATKYQKRLKVIAQDLDWLGVYMTYVQCSIIGIDAIVVQGDTLKEPYIEGYPFKRILRTPNHMGALV